MLWAFAAGCFLLQWILSFKVKKRILRWALMLLLIAGLAFCRIVYLADGKSESVIAENRYFAAFLADYFITGMVGCAAGYLLSTIARRKV